MVFSWLYSSSVIKDISAGQKDFTFKWLFSALHPVLKYALLLLAVYALLNFVKTFSDNSGESWLDFDPDYNKLRGISGFWLLFYMLGLSASYLKVKFSRGEQKE